MAMTGLDSSLLADQGWKSVKIASSQKSEKERIASHGYGGETSVVEKEMIYYFVQDCRAEYATMRAFSSAELL